MCQGYLPKRWMEMLRVSFLKKGWVVCIFEDRVGSSRIEDALKRVPEESMLLKRVFEERVRVY